MSGVDDVETGRKNYKTPYTPHHPVPTVHKYRQEKQQQKDEQGTPEGEPEDERSKLDRLGDAYNTLRYGKEAANPTEKTQPYQAENKNFGHDEEEADDHAGRLGQDESHEHEDGTAEDTTEGVMHQADPKKARKQMKKFSADGTEREVTDPVTHLPVKIHDFTNKDLKMTPKNGLPAGQSPETATGAANMSKSDLQLEDETHDAQDAHTAMETLFPPPDFDMARDEITTVYRNAITTGLGIVSVSLTAVVAIFQFSHHTTGWTRACFTLAEVAICLGVSAAVIIGMRQWTENKIHNVWETEVWQAERQQGKKMAKSRTAESAQWLNSLLASVWPLINPDLFTSISDTLEVSNRVLDHQAYADHCRTSCKPVCQN
jgi:hypothetical protein